MTNQWQEKLNDERLQVTKVSTFLPSSTRCTNSISSPLSWTKQRQLHSRTKYGTRYVFRKTKYSIRQSCHVHPLTCQQKSEFRSFIRQREETIHNCWNDGFDREVYCKRGFEPYFSASLNFEIVSHRKMHQETVFKEYARQQKIRSFSAHRLALKVSSISTWSLKRAQARASQDAAHSSAHQLCESDMGGANETFCLNNESLSRDRSGTSTSKNFDNYQLYCQNILKKIEGETHVTPELLGETIPQLSRMSWILHTLAT